jgi:hypothetical protein
VLKSVGLFSGESDEDRDIRGKVQKRLWLCGLTFKSVLLSDEVLLRRIRHRHKARVHRKTILLGRAGHVVVRGAAIPDDQVARISADLFPFEAGVLEPLHATFGETVPLRRPSGDARLVGHLFMELLGKAVATFAHDEAPIVGPARVQVHKALEAPEACLGGILVLVGPWFAAQSISSGR